MTEAISVDSDTALPGQVAAALFTTEAGLAQMRYRGTGPRFVKRGRRVLYRWSDVRDYLDANTCQRTDDPRGVPVGPAVPLPPLPLHKRKPPRTDDPRGARPNESHHRASGCTNASRRECESAQLSPSSGGLPIPPRSTCSPGCCSSACGTTSTTKASAMTTSASFAQTCFRAIRSARNSH
jgi:hypothetical protein